MKVAVIGIGRMGSRHAENLYAGRVAGCSLSCVCDISEDVIRRFAATHKGVRVYTDYKVMAQRENLDVVVVATPHYSHVEIAECFLRKGVSTLVEKPVSVSVEYAQSLNETARENPTALFGMMYNQRTNPVYSQVRDIVLSGKLGKIRRANMIVTDWYRSQYYYDMGGWRASWHGEGGGTLINQCVHQLDLLQWILGMPQSAVARCRTVNRDITTENEVCAMFDYGDFTATFTASAHEVPGTNLFEIAGDRGKITAGKFKAVIKLLDMPEQEINRRSQRDYGNKKDKKYRTYTVRYKLSSLIRDALYGQQLNILRNFTAAVKGKEKLIAPGSEGINALSLINAIYMSDYKGTKVDLPLNGKEYTQLLSERAAEEKQD